MRAAAAMAAAAALGGCHDDGRDGEFRVPPGDPEGAVMGYVRDQDGYPIRGASFRVEGGPANIPVEQIALKSDEDGLYWSLPLRPGRYRIIIGHRGFDTETASVTVRAGEASRVDFRLRRK